MRILLVSHMYPNSFNPVAGIFVRQQAEALQALGIELIVISPVPWAPGPLRLHPKWARYAEIPLEEDVNGIHVFHPRVPEFPRSYGLRFSGWLYQTSVKPLLTKLHCQRPFDLVHAHVALPDGASALAFCRHYNVPLVLTIHGQDFFHTIHRNHACRAKVQQVLQAAERVVLVSSKLRSLAEAEGLVSDMSKIKIVHNGVDLKSVYQGENPLQAAYAGKQLVLSVGYLIKRKGHAFMLEAISRLAPNFPQLRYLIVGSGEEQENLASQAKALGIAERVEFLGRRSHREVLQYMDACDIFALPSWDEAFGVVYAEAMAQGRPVIGCRGEGIEDFVVHGKTGYLAEPRDTESLTRILANLLAHPSQAVEVGLAARKVVAEEFTWDKCALKLKEVYASMLS